MDAKEIKDRITSVARNISATSDVGVSSVVNEIIRDRLLSRIFLYGNNEWVLKGGSNLLARVGNSRDTVDLDLFNRNSNIEDSHSKLIELSKINLADGFEFILKNSKILEIAPNQPYKNAESLKFEVLLYGEKYGFIDIDLVSGLELTGNLEKIKPVNQTNFENFSYSDYTLYPLTDQLADKICASLEEYNGFQSSRVKDLVDIVIIATHFKIKGSEFSKALLSEQERRNIENINEFNPPQFWKQTYEKLAGKTSAVPKESKKFTVAIKLSQKFINPVFDGSAETKTWDFEKLEWV